MNRKANWVYNVDKGEYIVTLMEAGQVVYTHQYRDEKLAELAKESWLQGKGPEFLAG